MVIGVLFAVSVLVGSVLAQWAPVAVVGMFLMGLGAALLATRRTIRIRGPHDLSSTGGDWFDVRRTG